MTSEDSLSSDQAVQLTEEVSDDEENGSEGSKIEKAFLQKFYREGDIFQTFENPASPLVDRSLVRRQPHEPNALHRLSPHVKLPRSPCSDSTLDQDSVFLLVHLSLGEVGGSSLAASVGGALEGEGVRGDLNAVEATSQAASAVGIWGNLNNFPFILFKNKTYKLRCLAARGSPPSPGPPAPARTPAPVRARPWTPLARSPPPPSSRCYRPWPQ